MHLKRLEILGFKSFAKKSIFEFNSPVSAVVGPNGSGKSNVAEAIRFVLGEQSMKSMRGKRGEDLIWNGSQTITRSNHASVSIVFDNTGNEFDVDYDEVVIKRQVFRDGVNQYFINNTQVRLRDIVEILAKVHIGATGHHIISQGEADRILNANIKERRAMIEEALGLKIYQWKISESEKKLAKTTENLKQVASLRREIAPHIRFLKSQVSKIEKAKEMRIELSGLYAEYLKREKIYLASRKIKLEQKRQTPDEELKKLEIRLSDIRAELAVQEDKTGKKSELARADGDISATRAQKDDMSRHIGRVEGMIEYEERRLSKARIVKNVSAPESVSYSKVQAFTSSLEEAIGNDDNDSISLEMFKSKFAQLRSLLGDFLSYIKSDTPDPVEIDTSELDRMKKEKKKLDEKFNLLIQKESELNRIYEGIKNEIEKEKDSSRELEKEMFKMAAERTKLSADINHIRSEQEYLSKEESAFKEEIKEGVVLIGRDISLYENLVVDEEDALAEERKEQEIRKKTIEKIKIRLEEHGLGGADEIMKEYDEVLERDSFLEREILDLKKSDESLRELISELIEKLDSNFKNGIREINKQFQEFFSLMFGGGNARLVVAHNTKRKRSDTSINLSDDVPDTDQETEEGIEVDVSLPRKKIRGLQMLSGGERALTSIALIFAVSQVNPPPFIVLDETDAALDEANSRKYGNMIENLSAHSQLVVITHNRETMSRAGILYGVTMGSDAVSKLLSVKFEEAESFAK